MLEVAFARGNSYKDTHDEPFAVLRLTFKLIHAWLNLPDKHISTGRINQTTTE